VDKPCGAEVVITIGAALVAPLTDATEEIPLSTANPTKLLGGRIGAVAFLQS
jgi:hypothetical protein